MILTIQQYIEALTNSEGRFRTLQKVYPVADGAGDPLFAVPGHGLADFEVVADGRRMTLRCPLRRNAETETKLHALVTKDKGLGGGFFTEWELREKEIVLFDGVGNAVAVDMLVRPAVEGITPEQFLQDAAAKGDSASILSALASLAALAEWAQSAGREVAQRRIVFSPDGAARVTGFSARGELGDVALAFFFTAAMPGRFADIGRPLLTRAVVSKPLAIRLCAEAAALGFREPGQILAGDIAGPLARLAAYSPEQVAELSSRLAARVELTETELVRTEETSGYLWSEDETDGIRCVKDADGWRYVARGNESLTDCVWLFAAPFREGRAEVETAAGKGLIDKDGRYVLEPVYEEVAWDEYWGLVAVMLEGKWSLLDRQGTLLTEQSYDWLGECSEGMVLAIKEGKCGFLDAEGREAIPFVYDDATSFSDGCALVSAEGQSFYIGGSGNKV